MNEADLLLVLGASFANHTGIYAGQPTIQVDRDPMQLGASTRSPCPVLGRRRRDRRARWRRGRTRRRATTSAATSPRAGRSGGRRRRSRAADDRGDGVSSRGGVRGATRRAPTTPSSRSTSATTPTSFGRYFECRGQAVLMSGYLGSIGFGFPAAMGAWAAAPGRPVDRGHRRRRLRAVPRRADDRGQARHEDHARAAQQRPARQDHQGAARGRVGRLADRAAQPGLRGLRAALRRAGHPRRPIRRRARRRAGRARSRTAGPALVEVITDPDLV